MARRNRDQKRIEAARVLANHKGKPPPVEKPVQGVWTSPSGILYYVNKRGVALPFVNLDGLDQDA